MDWRLAEAKNKFSELVNRALAEGPQRVIRRDDVVIVMALRDYERLTGYKSEELIGKSCRVLDCTGCEIIDEGYAEKWCGRGFQGNSQLHYDGGAAGPSAGNIKAGITAPRPGPGDGTHRQRHINHSCCYHRCGQPYPQGPYHYC